jgi:osmotically-inducible protein OsmY
MTTTPRSMTRRQDAEIFAAARKALDEGPVPSTVHVHIDDGVGWLTGTVSRAGERSDAEHILRKVDGVQRVVNRIVVTAPDLEGLDPQDLRRA